MKKEEALERMKTEKRTIEQLTDLDIMRADVLIGREKKTSKLWMIWPEEVSGMISRMERGDETVHIAAFEFEWDNEDHMKLIEEIKRKARGR